MGLTGLPSVLLAICVAILAIQRATAQTVLPTNDTSTVNSTTHFVMNTIVEMTGAQFNVIPLTSQAGLQGGSLGELEAIKPQGQLYLTNTSSVANINPTNIAYLSCEPGDYVNSALDATRTIQMAAGNKPAAIVFYSVYAAQCSFSPSSGPYNSFYTMITANASESLLAGLLKNNPPTPNTTLSVNPNLFNNGSSNGSGNDDGPGGSVLGKSPTTAVAMIILYSITGIITALFLAIIVVGAIRAHRHPERYGPRRVLGRPRQSRAKGIARAMLDTLPIVKFGDREEDKPEAAGRDVELANTTQTNEAVNVQEQGVHSGEQTSEPAPDHVTQSASVPAEDGPDIVTTVAVADTSQVGKDASDPMSAADNGLACSVCTDDFVKGQDIRVLPCKHKFHPECIDPWLLNVSGTCPLCRVDLHPTASHDPAIEGEDYDDGPSFDVREYSEVPHAEVNARRNRRSRILHTLNIGRMRHATPEERIAALRRLRHENQASDPTTEQGGRVGSSFSRRISRVLGGSHAGSRRASGILNSRPVSEIPHVAAEPATPTMLEMRSANETTSHPMNELTPPTAETAHLPPSPTEPPTIPEAEPPIADTAELPSPITEVISHVEETPSTPGATESQPQAETSRPTTAETTPNTDRHLLRPLHP